MTRLLRTMCAAAAFAALRAGTAGASIVVLKDGSAYMGTVVSATAREVVLYTPEGTRRFDAAAVRSIDYSAGGPSSKLAAPEPPPAPPPFEPLRERDEERLFGPRRDHVSFEFGLAAPLSDVRFDEAGGGTASDGDVGPLFGLRYLRDVSPRWSAGGEFRFEGRGGTDSPGLLANADASVSGSSVLFLGLLRRSFGRDGLRPYVLVGAGAHRTTTTIDAAPAAGFAWSDTGTGETRRLVDGDAWGAAATARAGVDFTPRDPGELSLEAGWTLLSRETYAATARGRALGLTGVTAPLQLFTLAVRWGWGF
ncbi:MAG: hypothetical protein HY079_02245 [Elusimicrobia bacterium]|nr:hypothetical protein [Elusimicrobiota bacterium]